MEKNSVIQVDSLSKAYKLYAKKSDRLREAFSLTHKSYHNEQYVLKDISFSVNRGETIGIIGTNGSGKSTLLKIISGVVSPTSGTFRIDGTVSALLELGIGFNPEYTGIENIDLNSTMVGIDPQDLQHRKEEIIKFADIGDYIYQPVKNYSSGMFARLAFAVAISVEPDILIVDEALSVGDMFFQSKCFRKFEELRKKGTSILFVSHDITTVRKMCTKVLWIEQGKQMAFGDTNEICNLYFNEQTRRLNLQNEQYLQELRNSQIAIQESKDFTLTVPKIHPNGESMLSDRAEILSVYVVDSTGALVNRMIADSTYSIKVISRYHADLENVIVGFVLTDRKGTSYLAENTFIDSQKCLNVKKGMILETQFTFTLPRIRSGEYEISPAIALGIQESHVNLTWLRGVCSVQLERKGYELAEISVQPDVSNRVIDKVIVN